MSSQMSGSLSGTEVVVGRGLRGNLIKEVNKEQLKMQVMMGSSYVRGELYRTCKLYTDKTDWDITGAIGRKICRKGMRVDPSSTHNQDAWNAEKLSGEFRSLFMTKRNNDIGQIRKQLEKGKT